MKKAISAICGLAFWAVCMTSAVVNAESEKIDQIREGIPEGTTILVGDIDTSGIVDLTDMTAFSLYMLGDMALMDEQKIYADTNLDDVLDMCDLADYAMYLAKKVSEESYNKIGENRVLSAEETEKEPETGDPVEQKYEKIYSTEETKEMLKYLWYYAAWNCTLPLKDLDARYPVEKLVTPENSVPYCIYQLEAEKRMFVFFDDTIDLLRQIVAVFIYDGKLSSDDFSELKEGMTLADVENIDASTKFMDSTANYPLGHKNTLHMTNDGFVKITYSESTLGDQYRVPADPEKFVITSVEFIPNGSDMSVLFAEEEHSYKFAVLDEDR